MDQLIGQVNTEIDRIEMATAQRLEEERILREEREREEQEAYEREREAELARLKAERDL